MSDEILTGEAVLLDVRPAGVLTRVGGQLLDLLIYFLAFMLISLAMNGIAFDLDEAAIAAFAIVMVVFVMVIIPTTVETLTRGKSVGKAVAGIRIVRDDGGPVRFRHAFVRAITGIFELWMTLGSIAFITSMLNRRGKRIGDFLAGTYAVRDRVVPYASAPLFMPPPLAGWAAMADIGRLPDGLALAARQFLGRLGGLTPQSRASLGIDLAAQLEKYVSPPPPIGTPPEAFVQAVLAERRERDYRAETQARAGSARLSQMVQTLPHGIPDPPS